MQYMLYLYMHVFKTLGVCINSRARLEICHVELWRCLEPQEGELVYFHPNLPDPRVIP